MNYFEQSGMTANDLSTLSWEDYFKKLNYNSDLMGNDVTPSYFAERIALLGYVKNKFKNDSDFQAFHPYVKKLIAGTNDTLFNTEFDLNLNGKLFGIMAAAGRFSNRINKEDQYIGIALKCIPSEGEVNEKMYENYLAEFRNAFERYNYRGYGLGVTTRLLAMKRPDMFICINNANKQSIRKIFGDIDKNNYWKSVVEPIQNMKWYKKPENINSMCEQELLVFECRAAMLDTLIYNETKGI
jgi:hypothetical protein